MPQRFSTFPDTIIAGTTVTVILTNGTGASFPLGASVTFYDANGAEIGGNGLPVFHQAGEGHPINVPENCATLTITSSQSQTLSKIVTQ
jgi:hypothetical protein